MPNGGDQSDSVVVNARQELTLLAMQLIQRYHLSAELVVREFGTEAGIAYQLALARVTEMSKGEVRFFKGATSEPELVSVIGAKGWRFNAAGGLDRFVAAALALAIYQLSSRPRYVHDCEDCTYLGPMERAHSLELDERIGQQEVWGVDLYSCTRHAHMIGSPVNRVFVARFGPAMNDVLNDDRRHPVEPHLAEARTRFVMSV